MPGLVPGILLFWGHLPVWQILRDACLRRLLRMTSGTGVVLQDISTRERHPEERSKDRVSKDRPHTPTVAGPLAPTAAICVPAFVLYCAFTLHEGILDGAMWTFPGICGRYRRNTAGLRLNLGPARLHCAPLPPISPRFRAARRDRACRGGSRMLPTISDPNILQGMGGSRQERTQNAQDEDQIGRQKAL